MLLLRPYDAYYREVQARASQLVSESTVSFETVRSVGLTFCVDSDQLESAVECGITSSCTSVEALSEKLCGLSLMASMESR